MIFAVTLHHCLKEEETNNQDFHGQQNTLKFSKVQWIIKK